MRYEETPSIWVAREACARAYEEARRLVYDRMAPGGLDRASLDAEQLDALDQFDAAEAALERLRFGMLLSSISVPEKQQHGDGS